MSIAVQAMMYILTISAAVLITLAFVNNYIQNIKEEKRSLELVIDMQKHVIASMKFRQARKTLPVKRRMRLVS